MKRSDFLKKNGSVQFVVVPNCREAIAFVKALIGESQYRQAESISVFGYAPVNNAHRFSLKQLNSLCKRKERVSMDFDIYCRRGEAGYFFTEDNFAKKEKAVRNVKIIKRKDQAVFA